MKKLFLLFLFLSIPFFSFAQATFQSLASGDWNNTSTWQLISGTSATNYPTTADNVTISSGHSIQVNIINAQCSQITVNAASSIVLNAVNNALTVYSTMSVSASSTITINTGALTVIGAMFLTAPTTGTGTTLLDVSGGLFTCVGGLTITALANASRTSELRIGNSLATVAGALVTTTINSKINFTGIGALTLAGLVTIANSGSFNAGNGWVVYVGIPNSNQTVASLTYNRLVITGIGIGKKTISGSVTVTDTLTLLSDTLQIHGSGSLKMNNSSVIVRTAGKIFSVPTFLGVVDIIYNNVTKDTTGLEMPTNTATLRNLTINNVSGVKLGASV